MVVGSNPAGPTLLFGSLPLSTEAARLGVMPRSIRQIAWKRAEDASYTDVTDAIEEGTIAVTPHPDEEIDRPKGYSITLTLKSDSTAFADDLQAALLDMEPAKLTVHLDGFDEPAEDVPVSVSKVPYPGDQNTAELGVPPDGHEKLHEYYA